MFCTNSSVQYYGNGVQTDFQFPYEYFEESDIKVLTWDNDTFSYKLNTLQIEYYFVNASTIRFTTPPPLPPEALPGEEAIPNVVLQRLTDVSEPMAIFSPGSQIKARDLNDNFDQLRFGIEETRCLVNQNEQLVELGWQKSDNDTLYSQVEWTSKLDDFHIPTVAAVELRLDRVEEDILIKAVNTAEQNSGLWISDDLRFATTGAIAARHDVVLSDNNPSPNPFIQPGKLWVDTRNQRLSYWSQQGFWVNIANAPDEIKNDYLFLEQGNTVVFRVTVGPKTSTNRFVNESPSQCFYIDGKEAPAILLSPNRKYRFDLTNASGYDFNLFTIRECNFFPLGESSGVVKGSNFLEFVVRDDIKRYYYSGEMFTIMGNVMVNPDGDESIGPGSVDTVQQTIDQLTSRIEQLEQDHNQLMNNNRGGY